MATEKRIASFEEGARVASDLLREERFVDAEPILRELAQMQPAHERVVDFLCGVLYEHGKFEDALTYYRNAVAHGAYPLGGDFDRVYEQSMVATRTCPAPLKRRARFHALIERLATVSGLEGCVVECGSYRGLSSHLMCARLQAFDPAFRGRNYHIFDSFQGLSVPTLEDEAPADDPRAAHVAKLCQPGAFAASLDEVRRNLSAFPEISYHPGWIPLTFRALPERAYRFIHLDVDLYDPTLSALEYFYPRLVRGGTIVCDDYAWPGARQAIREYCEEQRVEYTVTDTEQAVIVRDK
jgi:O-methyltransferase